MTAGRFEPDKVVHLLQAADGDCGVAAWIHSNARDGINDRLRVC